MENNFTTCGAPVMSSSLCYLRLLYWALFHDGVAFDVNPGIALMDAKIKAAYLNIDPSPGASLWPAASGEEAKSPSSIPQPKLDPASTIQDRVRRILLLPA